PRNDAVSYQPSPPPAVSSRQKKNSSNYAKARDLGRSSTLVSLSVRQV
ncbi:unnamed protein product, partial [Brassica oleracea]